MFYGYIGIGNMFCMYFMINNNSLEGFTGTGEAKYKGFSQEYFQKTLKIDNKKEKRNLLITRRPMHENP